MAVNSLQRRQINLMAFRFQIQRLTAAHTGDAAGLGQLGAVAVAPAKGHAQGQRQALRAGLASGVADQIVARLAVFANRGGGQSADAPVSTPAPAGQ